MWLWAEAPKGPQSVRLLQAPLSNTLAFHCQAPAIMPSTISFLGLGLLVRDLSHPYSGHFLTQLLAGPRSVHLEGVLTPTRRQHIERPSPCSIRVLQLVFLRDLQHPLM